MCVCVIVWRRVVQSFANISIAQPLFYNFNKNASKDFHFETGKNSKDYHTKEHDSIKLGIECNTKYTGI